MLIYTDVIYNQDIDCFLKNFQKGSALGIAIALQSSTISVEGKALSDFFKVKKHGQGHLPGGPVVQNPSSSAGDASSIPGWGTKILHAVRQLSSRVTTRESVLRLRPAAA